VIKELQDIIASKEIKLEKNKKLYKVSLQKGKTPDQYTWLEWDMKPNKEQVKSLFSKLTQEQLDKGFYYGVKPDATNADIYKGLSRALGSDKQASIFLLENGIDGIKYPAESISRGATSKTARGFNYVVFDENAVSIEEVIKFQKDANKARGAVMVTLDGEAVIYALTDPNVSTPLHELAHVFEHYLTDAEKNAIMKAAGTKEWNIQTSEFFARGFEKYLAEGKSPIPALDKLFAKFKEWLTEIYNGIKGSDIDIKLNKPMRDIYASMLGEKIEGAKFPDNISKIAKELNLSPQQIQNTYKKYDGSKKIEDITLEDYNKARAEGNKTKLDNSKKAFEALLKEENSKDKVSPTAQKELAKAKENVDDKALKAASKMMENIKEIREKLLGAKVIETIDCKWG
jgi:predicted transcriptional regulator